IAMINAAAFEAAGEGEEPIVDAPAGVAGVRDLGLDAPAGVAGVRDFGLDAPAGVAGVWDLGLDAPAGVAGVGADFFFAPTGADPAALAPDPPPGDLGIAGPFGIGKGGS